MQKICFVIPRAYYLFNPEAKFVSDKVGGAQKQAFLLSTELAKNSEFEVHFLTADFGQNDFEERLNVKIWKSFNFKNNIFKRVRKLLKTIKKINADIYIFRAADTGVAFAVFYIKTFLKKKVIYMPASNSESKFKTLKRASGFLTALTMPYVYKKADKITAQSETQQKMFLQDRKIKTDAIIRNIIEFDELEKETVRDNILWVGRLDKQKNPELFIESAKKYPDEKFIMIAPVVIESAEYGKNILSKFKNIPNLKIIDFVKPNEIKEYYKKAKLYIMSSIQEGVSNTMLEAITYGCPVLSLNVNPDTIFSDEKNGFYAVSNENKFYELFEKAINNPELCKEIALNALIYLKNTFSKDETVKNFIKILK